MNEHIIDTLKKYGLDNKLSWSLLRKENNLLDQTAVIIATRSDRIKNKMYDAIVQDGYKLKPFQEQVIKYETEINDLIQLTQKVYI